MVFQKINRTAFFKVCFNFFCFLKMSISEILNLLFLPIKKLKIDFFFVQAVLLMSKVESNSIGVYLLYDIFV